MPDVLTRPPTPDLHDYRGKMIAVASHVVVTHLGQLPDNLRAHAVQQGDTHKVCGFVLGTVLDHSVYGQFWVTFPWSPEPVQVRKENVLRIVLDDEAEPDILEGLPRLTT